MTADPRSPVCLKPAGGVAEAALTSAANLLEVQFDDSGSIPHCSLLRLADPAAVMHCRLIEDDSSLVETLDARNGFPVVTHSLSLTADRNLAEAWLNPQFAREAAAHGLTAFVKLNDGRQLLLGVSRRFGIEQPLRILSITVDSGRKPADQPAIRLLLESADTAFAATLQPFTNEP